MFLRLLLDCPTDQHVLLTSQRNPVPFLDPQLIVVYGGVEFVVEGLKVVCCCLFLPESEAVGFPLYAVYDLDVGMPLVLQILQCSLGYGLDLLVCQRNLLL